MTCNLRHIQEQICIGNEKAFTELFRHFNRRLYYFAKAITRSPELSEEVVEDVFVKLWSNRYTITSIENLSVYLYVAIKNTSLNAVSQKAAAFIQSPFDELEIEIGEVVTDPYNLMITSEMMKKMQQAVEGLPPRCKIIFKLVREDGLKYKEIAEILNISINTIDVQMAIATKKICMAMQVPVTKNGVLKKTRTGF